MKWATRLIIKKRAVGNSGLQVPLIVRFPDQLQAGTVVDDLLSLMDLGPTVLSLAGIQPPEYMHGKAFLGSFKSKECHRYAFGTYSLGKIRDAYFKGTPIINAALHPYFSTMLFNQLFAKQQSGTSTLLVACTKSGG